MIKDASKQTTFFARLSNLASECRLGRDPLTDHHYPSRHPEGTFVKETRSFRFVLSPHPCDPSDLASLYLSPHLTKKPTKFCSAEHCHFGQTFRRCRPKQLWDCFFFFKVGSPTCTVENYKLNTNK